MFAQFKQLKDAEAYCVRNFRKTGKDFFVNYYPDDEAGAKWIAYDEDEADSLQFNEGCQFSTVSIG